MSSRVYYTYSFIYNCGANRLTCQWQCAITKNVNIKLSIVRRVCMGQDYIGRVNSNIFSSLNCSQSIVGHDLSLIMPVTL